MDIFDFLRNWRAHIAAIVIFILASFLIFFLFQSGIDKIRKKSAETRSKIHASAISANRI